MKEGKKKEEGRSGTTYMHRLYSSSITWRSCMLDHYLHHPCPCHVQHGFRDPCPCPYREPSGPSMPWSMLTSAASMPSCATLPKWGEMRLKLPYPCGRDVRPWLMAYMLCWWSRMMRVGLSITADREEKNEREKKQDDELEMQYKSSFLVKWRIIASILSQFTTIVIYEATSNMLFSHVCRSSFFLSLFSRFNVSQWQSHDPITPLQIVNPFLIESSSWTRQQKYDSKRINIASSNQGVQGLVMVLYMQSRTRLA